MSSTKCEPFCVAWMCFHFMSLVSLGRPERHSQRDLPGHFNLHNHLHHHGAACGPSHEARCVWHYPCRSSYQWRQHYNGSPEWHCVRAGQQWKHTGHVEPQLYCWDRLLLWAAQWYAGRRTGTRLVWAIDLSQIPQCTCPISHNTPFRTDMSTFLFWTVHCGIVNLVNWVYVHCIQTLNWLGDIFHVNSLSIVARLNLLITSYKLNENIGIKQSKTSTLLLFFNYSIWFHHINICEVIFFSMNMQCFGRSIVCKLSSIDWHSTVAVMPLCSVEDPND